MPCFLQSVAVYVGEERKRVFIREVLKGALRYSILMQSAQRLATMIIGKVRS